MKAGKRSNLGRGDRTTSDLVQARSKRVKISDDYGTEHDYHLGALGAREGARIWRSLLETGASLGALFKRSTGSQEEAAGVAIEALAGAALEFLDDETLKQLMALVTRDGRSLAKGAQIDLAYSANYGEWALAIYHAVELNFGGAVRRLLGKLDGEAGILGDLKGIANAFLRETSPD